MAKIESILFDMDGVLIDAKEWHYEALNKALGLFGMEISRYDHLVTYDGLPTLRKLEMLSVERGLPKELHSFINELKQKFTVEFIVCNCRPTFYHEFALSSLRQMGYKMAVCSNSIRKTVELMLDRANLTEYFDFFLSNQDVTNSKPNPEIYLSAMDRMHVARENCLILEDNENGIKAAVASGAHVLKVDSVEDVNLRTIVRRIQEIEGGR